MKTGKHATDSQGRKEHNVKTGKHATDERLRTLLARAYRAREDREIDPAWQKRLMARIEEMGPLDGRTRFAAALDSLAWRIVPFTLAMSVAVVLFLAGLYVTTRYDEIQLTVRDAQELALRQAIGG